MKSAVYLVIAIVIGITIGAIWPSGRVDLTALLWPAVGVQVSLAIGALHWRTLMSRRSIRSAFALLGWHHLIATLPLVLVWVLLPQWHTSAALLGLTALAAVPPSAGLPAYAATARIAGPHLPAFTILASLFAPILTPLLAAATVGSQADPLSLAIAVVVTLIIPTAIGLVFGGFIRNTIPGIVRTLVVTLSLGLTSFTFGQAITSARDTGLAPMLLVLALTLGAARVVVAVVISLLTGRIRQGHTTIERTFAVTYKNDALAASLALPVGGPLAILPAVGSFLTSMIVMFVVAGRNRVGKTGEQHN